MCDFYAFWFHHVEITAFFIHCFLESVIGVCQQEDQSCANES
uniref:Uncharacterized protein n=1 Tax=Anguilla anguilla TaxID=7936 RepID=A0A0E9XZB4_ANGAN